ncbi:DUF2523 family protein [Vibrio vulnificus]|uniref:DUF2523 family protein n=1 Tax=Vibrio vulnificus TaxID=672 RepID=UPI001EEC288E|nr:DUF2523 family protein [Vibrio vulnificus]MCG6290235.1 DUF2523 domain-containing protein [Vibrio vulnificus]
MIRLLLMFSLLFSSFAFAEGETQPQPDNQAPVDSVVIQWAVDSFNDIFEVVEHTPNFIERMFAYLIEFSIYLKWYFNLEMLKFAYGVSQALISNIGLDSLIGNAVERLSPEYQNILQAFGMLRAISLICEAAVLRFVLNFMGW